MPDPYAPYEFARSRYADWGVDTEAALNRLHAVPVSLHCWQGDDVGGFEGAGTLDGGLAATGNYPGKARTADELRSDLDMAFRCLPGAHRLNLHAIYAETHGRAVERDCLEPEHFGRWMDWAAERGMGMDFNPTCFAHPLSSAGVTLTHPDGGIRAFWIRHVQACRRIGAAMGRRLGSPTVVNIWIPDGSKDTPVDTLGPRERLLASLDAALSESFDVAELLDSVESKLFGIGAESYTVGSHEFYFAYALRRGILLCLDSGHFHPTERVSDKLSAVLLFLDRVMLHVSRGVRWDSDHVVTLDDELMALAAQIVRNGFLDRVHLGLDYFDGSINRVAAWVIGARNLRKALLAALLEPIDHLRRAEAEGDHTARLALFEEIRLLPLGAVWSEFCRRQDAPDDGAWLGEVSRYSRDVLEKRGA